MSQRHCIKCGFVKPFSEFHKNKRTSTGVHNVCKICHNAAAKLRYQQQGVRLRQLMADQRLADYDYRLEIERASRARRKEAQRPLKNARQQIRNRLIQGKKFQVTAQEIARLYKNPCFRCGTYKQLSIDHIIPLVKGGNHSIGNLMTLCRPCNASKGKKFLVEWKRDTMKVEGN